MVTLLEQYWRYSRDFEAEINPFRIIWINPHSIYQKNKQLISKSERHLSHIIGGQWDEEKEPFKETLLYKSLEEHFKNDKDWKDTELFLKVVEGDHYWRGIETREEFEERASYLDELYEDIKANGFKTYKEVTGQKPGTPKEIKVHIGRDGSYFYLNGKHRLIISLILNIDKIPVNVTVRHKKWQQFRDEVARSQSIADLDEEQRQYLDHPDIRYLM